jgi:thiol:disulfide interchange protein
MTLMTKLKSQTRWQVWGAIMIVLVAIATTLSLTRPAAVATSMTPVSGLIALQTLAHEALPYPVALENGKPTLIEFYADWCTTCQGMAHSIQALHEQYGEKINFVMLNIDDPRWAPQITEYGASGVPQFTLLDSHHQAVRTLVGKVPKSIFQELFQQSLG